MLATRREGVNDSWRIRGGEQPPCSLGLLGAGRSPTPSIVTPDGAKRRSRVEAADGAPGTHPPYLEPFPHRRASPLPRHARTCSGHPRLAASRCRRGEDDPAAPRGCPEQVHCCPVWVFGAGCTPMSETVSAPAVTPDLIRGPGKPGEGGACGPRIGIRDKPAPDPSPGPGPRIKSGVTAGGGRRGEGRLVRPSRNSCPDPAEELETRLYQRIVPGPPHLNRTAVEQVRA